MLSFSSCRPGVACSGTDPTWKCICNLSGYHSRTIYDVAWCVAAQPRSPRFPLGSGGSRADPLRCPPAGATSLGRWPRPAATTPSGSLRRAPRPRRSSPPSASPPTCPAHTRRMSTAWPGTPRSRGCWPPAATTARSPSGSTSGPKSAESSPQRLRAAVLATKPLGEESRTGPGWATSCIPPPRSIWTSALWQPAAGGFGGARKEPASRGGPATLPRDTHRGAAPLPGSGRQPQGVASPSCSVLNKSLPCSKPPALPFGAVTAPPAPGEAGQGVRAAPGLGEAGEGGRPPGKGLYTP